VKRNSMTFFEGFLIIKDTISFLDQGKVLRRIESYMENLIKYMRLACFFLVFRRMFFGGRV
jgi:hypothetical protein